MDRALDDPLTRGFCTAAMTGAAAVGAHIGCAIDQTPQDRHVITRKLGAFKPSMLQDVQAGRPVKPVAPKMISSRAWGAADGRMQGHAVGPRCACSPSHRQS